MFGVVTDESFESQLSDLKDPVKKSTIVSIERGRGNVKEVPSELRKLISEDALKGIKAKELNEAFGISESSVSAYKNGSTSTSSYNEPDIELVKHNDKVREDIVTGARSKLLSALESITDEKLRDAKVRDAASVAKDMSAVIKNIEPQQNQSSQLNQQFIFMTPPPRGEESFEVIESRD